MYVYSMQSELQDDAILLSVHTVALSFCQSRYDRLLFLKHLNNILLWLNTATVFTRPAERNIFKLCKIVSVAAS